MKKIIYQRRTIAPVSEFTIVKIQSQILLNLILKFKFSLCLGYEEQIPGYPRYTMLRDPVRGSFNLQIKRAQLDDEGKHCHN